MKIRNACSIAIIGSADGPTSIFVNKPLNRIPILDALRGLSIVLMVAYHAGYNLFAADIIGEELFFHPVLRVLQYFFAGLFVLLAGISSRFSRSNVKRGLWLLAAALVVTVVTTAMLPNPLLSLQNALGFDAAFPGGVSAKTALQKGIIGVPVTFGILHFLAVSILLYALLQKRGLTVPFVLLAGFMSSLLGWERIPGWLSSDYFSFLPWFFVFVLGTELGKPIGRGQFPPWFYTLNIPVLPFVGRHTLIVYMLHQPVLYGVFWLFGIFQ